MQFYTKGENGDFGEVSEETLNGVIGGRIKRAVSKFAEKVRGEVEDKVREELTPKLTEEIEKQIKDEYQPKLEEAEKKSRELDIKVRQKTIAAEYGFSAELEGFLGDGSDDEMKAKADILKDNRPSSPPSPEKKTATGLSEVQKQTGIPVTI